MQRLVWASMIVGVFLLAVGCGPSAPKMTQHNIVVTLDEGMRDPSSGMLPSIEVDLIAVGQAASQSTWEYYSMSNYFSGSDRLRQDSGASGKLMTLPFTNQSSREMRIEKNDPIWAEWKGAMHLYIMANLIGMQDQPGSADARREILKFDTHRMDSDTIFVTIRSSGVQYSPGMTPRPVDN